jgi:hypothetical protein
MSPKFHEIAQPDKEPHENVSKLPEKANPIHYFRSKYKNEADKASTAFEAYPEADGEDLLQFVMRNPEFVDKVEDLEESRFRRQSTGVTIDVRSLDKASSYILDGVNANPVYSKSPDRFLKDHDQFVALMEYLRHLSLTGKNDALEIRSKIDGYINLSDDQVKILRDYLARRSDYIE